MAIKHEHLAVKGEIIEEDYWNANHTGTLNHQTEITNVTTDQHHAQSHSIASHNDTTATGAELETLTNNSMADTLHRHSELSASDGTPDANLTLDATGQVGIRTSTPAYTLDIHNGGMVLTRDVDDNLMTGNRFEKIRDGAIVEDDDLLGYYRWLGYDGATQVEAAEITVAVDGVPGRNDMPGRMQFWTTADGANTASIRMTIKNDGNVGIGTTTPTSQLHIVNGTGLWVQSSAATIKMSDITGNIFMRMDNSGNLEFLKHDGTTDMMHITTATGNVGIGTTTPEALFSVAGRFKVQSDGVIKWGSNVLTGSEANAGYLSWDTDEIMIGGLDAGTAMTLVTGGNDRMRIQSGGKVGIGVTDPHSLLEVNGAISSGFITVETTTHQDALDVSGANSVFCYPGTAAGDITIGGLANGVIGQIIHIVKVQSANDLIIEHNEGTGTQKILIEDSVDKTFNTWGGVTLVYDGAYWFVVSE